MAARALMVLGLSAMLGCSARDAGRDEPQDDLQGTVCSEILVLELDRTSTTADGSLNISWVEIRDSRCPTGVTCVWAGDVAVELSVVERGLEPVDLTLALHPRDPSAAEAELKSHGLKLLSVSPWPEEHGRTPRRDFQATIKVTPADPKP